MNSGKSRLPEPLVKHPVLNGGWLNKVAPYGSVLFGGLAILFIWVGEFYYSHSELLQTQTAALQNANNLSRAFEEHLIRSIRGVDQTLLYARDVYARDPNHFNMSLWTKNSQFLNGITFQVALIGKDGLMIGSNIPGAKPGLDLSDREHFKVHAQRSTDELFISKPVLGRVSKKWSIQFTRRITMQDGSFGGVVVVSVSPDYLSKFYKSIDVGQHGAISLIGTDGIVRARGAEGPSVVGRSIANGDLLRAAAKAANGHYETVSTLDGVRRLFVYRKVQNYPLLVVIGLAHNEIYGAFEKKHRVELLISSLLTLLLLGATYLMVRYERELSAARDAAEAGTRARSEFLAMMSHEIRTPINGVIGMADILVDSGLNEQQLPCANTLRDLARHLLQIINDVLDFSKLEACGGEIEYIDFDLHELLRNFVSLLSAHATAKSLYLRVKIAPDVPRWVNGDPARLRQLLLNLVGNGLKFTSEGGVTISVDVGGAVNNGQIWLNFAVSDTGIGMPADGLHLLFREFSQLDSSIARRFGGTGLGLAICKRLIDLMGGVISVQSQLGKGTTFSFAIHYPVAAERYITDAPALAPVALTRCDNAQVLLVEDNKTNQLVASKYLGSLGFLVDIANNGAEAVEACRKVNYDVVFMDIMMPGMDGLAATKAIRELPMPRSQPFIIALTANAQSHDRKICLEAGMDDYLAKPFTRADLAAKLESFCGGCSGSGSADPVSLARADLSRKPNAVVFDPAVYAGLAEALGSEDALSILETFIEDTKQRIEIMLRVAKENDKAGVEREAHAIKGSAGTLGFMRLSEQARMLEHAMKRVGGSAMESSPGDVVVAFDDIQGQAAKIIAAQGAPLVQTI
jgi:signal transduction histidine kinase/CheY-like chemotaxis protein/HPt (histidine-containing phosphotransfer) domain-containing protein